MLTMKKYLMMFVALFVVVSLFPVVISKSVLADKQPTLRVLTDEGVQEMTVEEYTLRLILAGSDDTTERETMKALTVAARSCAVYLSCYGCKHEDFDVCSDGNCCFSLDCDVDTDSERYVMARECLDETQGLTLCVDKLPAMALYTLCAGSGTGDCEEFCYLASVPEPERCETHKTEYRLDESVFTLDTLQDACIVYGNNQKCEFAVIDNRLVDGRELQSLLDLPTREVILTPEADGVRCVCYGVGHGYGLNLCGANKKAQEGMGFCEILKYYYPELSLTNEY
jgi:hypothetical protein